MFAELAPRQARLTLKRLISLRPWAGQCDRLRTGSTREHVKLDDGARRRLQDAAAPQVRAEAAEQETIDCHVVDIGTDQRGLRSGASTM